MPVAWPLWGATPTSQTALPVFQVIDITNPASPGIVGSVDTPGDARGVAVVGSYAYVADGARSPGDRHHESGKPGIVGSVDTPGVACGVAVVGSYAYVADCFGVFRSPGDRRHESGKPGIVGSVDTPWRLWRGRCGDYAYVAD